MNAHPIHHNLHIAHTSATPAGPANNLPPGRSFLQRLWNSSEFITVAAVFITTAIVFTGMAVGGLIPLAVVGAALAMMAVGFFPIPIISALVG